MEKKLYILAGANGSGKSTISRVLLPTESLVYVNPDDIAARVQAGGHYVPDDDVRRRYYRSKKNFIESYAKAVDEWTLCYNGGLSWEIVAYDCGELKVINQGLYRTFLEGIDHA